MDIQFMAMSTIICHEPQATQFLTSKQEELT